MNHEEIKAEAERRGYQELVPTWCCDEENECFTDCSDLYDERMRKLAEFLENGLDNFNLDEPENPNEPFNKPFGA